jgi:hypothetical protein
MPETVYFSKPGPSNLAAVVEASARRAQELDIKRIVVASNEGQTAKAALEAFPGREVIVVTHVAGFREANTQEMADDIRADLQQLGAKVLTTQHAFAGVNRAIRFKFNTYEINEIIASSLRVFGDGTKVAIEIAMMAADAGYVRTDEEIICVAGTGRGADTALVIQPANSHRFFDLKVKEVICKPR